MAAEDWFDEYTWDGFDEDENGYPKEIRCRHCGSDNVYWAESRGKLILYDIASSRNHRCSKAGLELRSANNVSAFEDIS